MNTIEVTEETGEILAVLAQRHAQGSIDAYLGQTPEVQNERRRRREQQCLKSMEEKSVQLLRFDLWERFLICVLKIHEIDPAGFERLEGFTKPEGRAIFISRSESKILQTSDSAKPKAIGNTGWFLNVHGGQNDFEHLIKLICREVGLSPSIPAQLIEKTVKTESSHSLLAL